jgi:hypothetical protein
MINRLITWIAIRTAKFECWPHYNRWLAGLHVLLWNYVCGYGWRWAWGNAMIYWSKGRSARWNQKK